MKAIKIGTAFATTTVALELELASFTDSGIEVQIDPYKTSGNDLTIELIQNVPTLAGQPGGYMGDVSLCSAWDSRTF